MVSAIRRYLGVYFWVAAGYVAVFGILTLVYAADQFWRACHFTIGRPAGDGVLQHHYRTVAAYVAVIALVHFLVCAVLIAVAVRTKWRGTSLI
jgi:hypothetical protein